MGKYLIIFKNSISESLIYRTSVFLMFASQFFSTVVLILLWTAIYESGGKIGSYSLNELVRYYILIGVISFTIQGVDVSWRVAEEIKSGGVTNYILKPISYFRSILAIVFGKSFFNFIISLVLVVPLIIWSGYFSDIGGGPLKLVYFILSIMIAWILFVTYSFTVALYTFWAGDVRGLNYTMKMVMLFFSGAIIPLDLLPDFIARINQFLPFKSMTWIPVSIIIGKIEPGPTLFLTGIFWVFALLALEHIIYNQALKKYEGLGA